LSKQREHKNDYKTEQVKFASVSINWLQPLHKHKGWFWRQFPNETTCKPGEGRSF